MTRVILMLIFTFFGIFGILQAFPSENADEKPPKPEDSVDAIYQILKRFDARGDTEPPVDDDGPEEEPVPVPGDERMLAFDARGDLEPPIDDESMEEEPVPVPGETNERKWALDFGELDDDPEDIPVPFDEEERIEKMLALELDEADDEPDEIPVPLSDERAFMVDDPDSPDGDFIAVDDNDERRISDVSEDTLTKLRMLAEEMRDGNRTRRLAEELNELALETRAQNVYIYGVNIDDFAKFHPKKKLRSGQALETIMCNKVQGVPSSLRNKDVMWPKGIQTFYKKYTHAYGIPIIGSSAVTDEGLRRACYEVAFILGPHYGIRNTIYKFYGRVALIADREEQTTLPEYSNMDKKWDKRARGLGATMGNPTTSVGDDNMRCAAQNGGTDRYRNQDILAHEFGHTVHTMGAVYTVKGFARRLGDVYRKALAAGKWTGTYAGSKMTEYFATGMQFFMSAVTGFKVKSVVDHSTLKSYDPSLYSVLQETYSCDNTRWIERCDYNGRNIPSIQRFCATGPHGTARCTSVPANQRKQCGPVDNNASRCQKRGCCYDSGAKKCYYPKNECKDVNFDCAAMAQQGWCDTNQPYMYVKCPFSCDTCEESKYAKSKFTSSELDKMCQDKNKSCSSWAKSNYCTNKSYKSFMASNCKRTCTGCTPPKYPFGR